MPAEILWNQLDTTLKQGVAPLYCLVGEEVLLQNEAVDAIRLAAKASGCTERSVFMVDQYFKWDVVLACNSSLSLFGDKSLIEIRLPSGRPGSDGASALERYITELNRDNVSIISLLAKRDKALQDTKWYAALQRSAVMVSTPLLTAHDLPKWLRARFSQQSQEPSAEALQFLVEHTEGNLLAADQEVKKLSLLAPKGRLELAGVCDVVLDASRFSLEDFSEAMLSGDVVRLTRIINHLEASAEALPRILWRVGDDLHGCAKVAVMVQSGTSAAQAVKNARIWGPKSRLIERAAPRLTASRLRALIKRLAELDATSKGVGPGDAWTDLRRLACDFTKMVRG